MKKLLCAALGSAAAFTGGSLGLASYILRIPRQSLEQALDWQRDHYDISWLETTPQEPYTVTSWDGYTLHAVVLRPAVELRAAQSSFFMVSLLIRCRWNGRGRFCPRPFPAGGCPPCAWNGPAPCTYRRRSAGRRRLR